MSMTKKNINIEDMIKDSKSVYEDTGAEIRIFEFSDSHDIDRVLIRFDPDDEIPSQMRVYEDTSNEPNEVIAFQHRDIRFPPISVIGKPESSELFGVTPTIDSFNSVPEELRLLWQSIGFTVVPEGREWLL